MQEEETDKIIKQSSRWIIFGAVAPIAYVLMVHTLLFISVGYFTFANMFYCALGITAFVFLAWWFWALMTIIRVVKMTDRANKDLTETINSVTIIKKEVEETNKLLRVITSKTKK